jgi:putative transposase
MLNRDNLISWYKRIELSTQAQSLIDHVRSSAPTRRVGGGHGNVTGRYPSRKMGLTIQFESHRVELAAIYEMEYDADVLEYWDQPPSIKLHYRSPLGRQMGVLHTPDFFVIRQNSAGWEEWKTEEGLRKLTEHNPNRYCRADTGQWRSPPGEGYASGFSLYYRVRSSREIDWVFQRNVQFLEDYLRTDPTTIPSRIRETGLAHAAAAPGLSLDELFNRTKEAISRDQIYWLIAAGVLYANLHEFPLIEPTRVAMFPSPEAALARTEGQAPHPQEPAPASVVPRVGSSFSWDGKTWKIVNVGERHISALSDGGPLVELPIRAFETLVKAGKVTVLPTTQGGERDSRLTEYLSRASEDDLKIANYRCELVSKYLRGELPLTNQIVPRRTLCRWTARYRRAQTAHGRGYIGLLPGLSRRGNCTAKLPEASQRLLMQFIERDYETPKQKTKYAVWAALKLGDVSARLHEAT